jgi:hypothetical protein
MVEEFYQTAIARGLCQLPAWHSHEDPQTGSTDQDAFVFQFHECSGDRVRIHDQIAGELPD